MSEHQSEQHFNDLTVEQLFKEYKQAVEAVDTITTNSILSVVSSWPNSEDSNIKRYAWNLLIQGLDRDFGDDGDVVEEPDSQDTSTKPRLTFSEIVGMIREPTYQHLSDGRTTICLLNLRNGSTTVGKSQVLYAENNVPELGDEAAWKNAVEKLWDLAGFKHYQDRHELELVKDAILPGIRSLGDGADTQRALQDAWPEVSPAVQLLAVELQDTLMSAVTNRLKKQVSSSTNRVSTWPTLDVVSEIEDNLGALEEHELREALQLMITGYKNYSAHVAKQQSELLRENRRLSDEATKHAVVSNFQLTSRINMVAGNHPDGSVQQLRRQAGLIHEEVKELLGHLHLDALYKFDFVEIATALMAFKDDVVACRGEGWATDEVFLKAEEFLKLHEYQKTLFTSEALPGASVSPYAVRDDIQDILVTTYGLSHYMGFDADEDHREVYRSNMTKFDPAMELAIETQKKYKALGVTTVIRTTHAKWEGFEGDYYVNVVEETAKGTDGKHYPKGKFLKSVRFEEPRYKPVILRGSPGSLVEADGLVVANGEEVKAADVQVGDTLDFANVSPAIQETLNNPPDAYIHPSLLEGISLHASEPKEERLSYESLLGKASEWLNAADNGKEFTGKLRSLKENHLVMEALDDREKAFFTRINKSVLVHEDGSSRTLADFLYQVTKLPPIRIEE